MHARQPVLAERGRWVDPRVAGNTGVTQGMHVRAILVDPRVYLISSADGPVAGDEDIGVACRALEQPQRGEVVLDRVSGVVQVEHRNQDIRKHVAGDENPAFLDQQRRMARGVRLMLDDPDLRAIPGNPRSFGGQAGNGPSRSSGTCSAMSGGISCSAMRAFPRASDSRTPTVAAQRAVPYRGATPSRARQRRLSQCGCVENLA